jgi:hypothetical protein
MDNFNEYHKGSKFMLYKDLITEPSLGTTQVKTLNRLKTAMSEQNFETRNRQKSNLPDFLKMGQTDKLQTHMGNPVNFNEAIHVDTFCTTRMPEKVIITITDDSTAFSVSTIITDNSTTSTITALQDHWFRIYGYPETISFKQGKVQASKLEKKINDLAPLKQKVTCKSRMDTFNTEVEQKWEQNQHEISQEEFADKINFFHEFQEPEQEKNWVDTNSGYSEATGKNLVTDGDLENEDEPGNGLEDLYDNHPANQPRRKSVSLCRHKLQGRT